VQNLKNQQTKELARNTVGDKLITSGNPYSMAAGALVKVGGAAADRLQSTETDEETGEVFNTTKKGKKFAAGMADPIGTQIDTFDKMFKGNWKGVLDSQSRGLTNFDKKDDKALQASRERKRLREIYKVNQQSNNINNQLLDNRMNQKSVFGYKRGGLLQKYQTGGIKKPVNLFETDKAAYVDSVLTANQDKKWLIDAVKKSPVTYKESKIEPANYPIGLKTVYTRTNIEKPLKNLLYSGSRGQGVDHSEVFSNNDSSNPLKFKNELKGAWFVNNYNLRKKPVNKPIYKDTPFLQPKSVSTVLDTEEIVPTRPELKSLLTPPVKKEPVEKNKYGRVNTGSPQDARHNVLYNLFSFFGLSNCSALPNINVNKLGSIYDFLQTPGVLFNLTETISATVFTASLNSFLFTGFCIDLAN